MRAVWGPGAAAGMLLAGTTPRCWPELVSMGRLTKPTESPVMLSVKGVALKVDGRIWSPR